jgi:aerobic carbon-monoxide dehydrogenase small subunit
MLIRVTVNGELVEREVEPRRRLVDFVREDLGLVGANIGCGHGVCGACTVLFDGVTMKSCLLFAVQSDGHELTTIEGISPAEGLSDVQAAFKRNFSIQCGYCAPGFVLAVQQLLDRYEHPSDEEIAFALSGNLCRCSGYVNIFKAVRELAEQRAGVTT